MATPFVQAVPSIATYPAMRPMGWTHARAAAQAQAQAHQVQLDRRLHPALAAATAATRSELRAHRVLDQHTKIVLMGYTATTRMTHCMIHAQRTVLEAAPGAVPGAAAAARLQAAKAFMAPEVFPVATIPATTQAMAKSVVKMAVSRQEMGKDESKKALTHAQITAKMATHAPALSANAALR